MYREIYKLYSIKIISYYTGYIIQIVTALITIPIIVALCFQEWSAVIDFCISAAISFILGSILIMFGLNAKKNSLNIQWKHGFVIASLSWIVLMFLCSIPYLLSGHLNSILDACFDVMSGFTTTGLALTQDLDHLSNSLNVWRHMLTFIGGQGMVVLAITFLAKELGGAYKMYVGEGKDIELLPNIKGTTRYI